MLSRALPPARKWLAIFLTRRLSGLEALAFGLVFVAAGTAYCQVYCLLALQKMHGASMPLWASLIRASSDVVPAFLVFEAGKRALAFPRAARWPAIALIFGSGIALGVLIRSQIPMMSQGLTQRHMAVDRIPFMLLAGAALGYYWRSLHRTAEDGPWPASAERDQIPPPKAIEWVRAAGNYVEIRVAGRTRLVRMTLRQARELLPAAQFIQIHRSVIVNRERIVMVRGRRSVEMADGTAFTVGDAHRFNLPAA